MIRGTLTTEFGPFAITRMGSIDDFGAHPILDGFRSRVIGIGPQIGFLFPVGDMQGYLNLKGYGEFDAANRPSGWNTWLTFAISPAAAIHISSLIIFALTSSVPRNIAGNPIELFT